MPRLHFPMAEHFTTTTTMLNMKMPFYFFMACRVITEQFRAYPGIHF